MLAIGPIILFLIDIQLCCQRTFVWWALQVVRKPRLLARLHEGQPTHAASSLAESSNHVLNYFQVAGHVEDEHMCSARVHMCGMVRVHFRTSEVFRSEIPDMTSRALSNG